MFFIDGTGEFVAGDFITALLAEAFLIKNPGSKIVYDVRASYAVKDIVAKYGGTALMNRVGHAFFKRRMREENAIFGGEVTGHYYFRDFYYADNGFIPALLILELMSRKGQTLAGLLAPLREKLHLRRDQHAAQGRNIGGGEDGRPRGDCTPRANLQHGWRVGGVPQLALQRPRLEHRAAAPPQPGGDDRGLMEQKRDEVLAFIRS